ncbi:MoaD/ThiS family protein [Candidatus Bathyarchaeota archaeon]|nr:MoaD/ThiS family protein [Candidatus Bathyarchaeota archaeon]
MLKVKVEYFANQPRLKYKLKNGDVISVLPPIGGG